MSFDFSFFLYLGIALIFARLLGEIFERIKLSSIIGELLSGLLIGGPIFILFGVNEFHVGKDFIFSFEKMSEAIEPFAQIGILLLLFIVGSQIRIDELRKAGRRNLFISITDVSITFGIGFLTGYLIIGSVFDVWNIGIAAFFGLTFMPTSIGTTVRTLSNIKKLNTKEGQTLLSLAVFDDFLALLFLLIVSGLVLSDSSGTGLGLFVDIIIQVAFIVVLLVIVLYLLPKLLEFFEERFNTFSLATTSYFSIGIVLAILLTTAFFAEYLGISAAIGAFLLGVGMQRNKLLMTDPLDAFIKIGEGTLIPLFFFAVGSSFVLEEFKFILIIIIPIAILAKMMGSFTGALFSTNPIKEFIFVRKSKQKKSNKAEATKDVEKRPEEKFLKNIKPNIISSAKIATGMIPKGEITLVVAAIGLAAAQSFSSEFGIIAGELYSVIILLVLVTVFLTPILLRFVFRTPKHKEKHAEKIEENK